MIGISYFAMTQLEAAVEQPPHLKAIFPLETTIDLCESAMHNGLMSSSFVTTFLAMIGMTYGRTLSTDEEASGQRTYMTLGAGLNRARASEADPPCR
jgi:predicted acyl esterase